MIKIILPDHRHHFSSATPAAILQFKTGSMQHSLSSGFARLATLSSAQQIQLLLEEIYPQLFQQLKTLNDTLSIWTEEPDNSPRNALLFQMNQELIQLYRKEQLELYPFLLELQAAGKQSDCCSPFKKVKIHYTSLLSAGAQLQQLLELQAATEPAPDAGQALDHFLQKLISAQIHKEKYVLTPFRNCTGSCKTISNE